MHRSIAAVAILCLIMLWAPIRLAAGSRAPGLPTGASLRGIVIEASTHSAASRTTGDAPDLPLSAGEYRLIRKKFRVLEFFSLGFLLTIFAILTIYALRQRAKGLMARRAKNETYHVEELTSLHAILAHLSNLSLAGTIASFTFPADSGRYQSSIENIFPGEGMIALKPLSPPDGNRKLGESSSVRVDYLYEEVPYSFVTIPGEWESKEEGKALLVIPGLIKYTQRRISYRVLPPSIEPVSVNIPTGGANLHLTVEGLSSGGFSLITPHRLVPGTLYRGAKLFMPGYRPLRMNCRCVYANPLEKEGEDEAWRLGFEFMEKGVFEERLLMHYVSKTRRGEEEVNRR